jgi:hypothetical protein
MWHLRRKHPVLLAKPGSPARQITGAVRPLLSLHFALNAHVFLDKPRWQQDAQVLQRLGFSGQEAAC